MGWRESLEVLQRQFESQAAASRGLHHLMVEVADGERDRLKGPDWFVREACLESPDPTPFLRADPWYVVQGSGLPWVHPRFREVQPDEPIDGIPAERIIRDGCGVPRAILEPMRLRFGYLCGDHAALSRSLSLAEAASRVLTGVPELTGHEYAEDIIDLFCPPRGGIRYVFGDVPFALTVLSSRALAEHSPSGLKATLWTPTRVWLVSADRRNLENR